MSNFQKASDFESASVKLETDRRLNTINWTKSFKLWELKRMQDLISWFIGLTSNELLISKLKKSFLEGNEFDMVF